MKILFAKFNDLTLKTGVKVKKNSRSEKMWRYIINLKNEKVYKIGKNRFFGKISFFGALLLPH